MSQLNINTDKLKELLDITNNLPKPGADLADATATENDVAVGKIAYGADGRFEGKLAESKAASTLSVTDSTPTISGTNLVLNYTHSSDRIMRANSANEIKTPLSNLGNASPDQVLNSATFTSSNSGGIAKTGNIVTKTQSDLTASGRTVTVPAGYYASQASKSIATATQATPTISFDTSTGVITASATQSAGYVSSGTKTATDSTSIALKTQSDLTVSGATVSVPAGYYASNASKSVTTVSRAATTMDTSIDTSANSITFTGKNNQSTGYVTGSNSTASKTVTLSSNIENGQVISKTTITDSGSYVSEVINFEGITITPKVPEASYGFTLQSDGYYKNDNCDPTNAGGYHNTFAVARINYNFKTETAISIEAIISAEGSGSQNYDFGVISYDNTALPTTSANNGTNAAYRQQIKPSTSGGTSTYTYNYSFSGYGFFDIGYRKDGSTSSGTDSLKFKINISGSNSSSNSNIVDTTITDTATTATSADILSGKKAYVNGQLVEGNISTKTSSNVTVNGNTVTIPAGYYASSVTKTVSGSSVSQGTVVLGPPSTDYNMGYVYSTSTYVTINYTSTKPTYDSSTQTLSLSGTSSLQLSSSSTADSVKSTLSGKYITITSRSSMSMGTMGGSTTSTTTSAIFYVPSSATFNVVENTSGTGSWSYTYYTWSASGLQLCNAYYST